MLVRITRPIMIHAAGVTGVRKFKAGEEVVLDPATARRFIRAGAARLLAERAP